MKAVRTVIVCPNRMVFVGDADGQQIPELQGVDTPELRATITAHSDTDTVWEIHQPLPDCYRHPELLCPGECQYLLPNVQQALHARPPCMHDEIAAGRWERVAGQTSLQTSLPARPRPLSPGRTPSARAA